MFIVRASSGDMTFTWEIRRHGGIVMQKGTGSYPSMALAKAAGLHALMSLSQDPNLQRLERQIKSTATVLKHP